MSRITDLGAQPLEPSSGLVVVCTWLVRAASRLSATYPPFVGASGWLAGL